MEYTSGRVVIGGGGSRGATSGTGIAIALMGDLEHRPVLVNEVIKALKIRPDGCYVDATYGRGGHAAAILECLGSAGRLLAIDRDPEAVEAGRKRFAGEARIALIKGRFSMLRQHLESSGMTAGVDGILIDLGASSPQFDCGARGFSFMRPGALDMRMDPDSGRPVADWLNTVSEADIAQVLWTLGEERLARRIARALVAARAEAPIRDTGVLTDVIRRAAPFYERGKHPATRTFQALRMYINQEIEELERILPESVAALRGGGRLAVIAFHSLEDRIVKRFIRDQEGRREDRTPDLPVPAVAVPAVLRRVGHQIRPADQEVAANPRARSACLRVAERVTD